MIFTRTTPNENFPLVRVISETGRWEAGFYPVLFGVRVRAGIVGNAWHTVDYCAGDNEIFAIELFATLIGILQALPESITERELQDLLPKWRRRPINLDDCWPKLQELNERLTLQAAL